MIGGEKLTRSVAMVYFTSSNITRFHPIRADKVRTSLFKEVLMTENTTPTTRQSWLATNLLRRRLSDQQHRRRLSTSRIHQEDHRPEEACYLVAACCYSSILATFLIMNISLYLATMP